MSRFDHEALISLDARTRFETSQLIAREGLTREWLVAIARSGVRRFLSGQSDVIRMIEIPPKPDDVIWLFVVATIDAVLLAKSDAQDECLDIIYRTLAEWSQDHNESWGAALEYFDTTLMSESIDLDQRSALLDLAKVIVAELSSSTVMCHLKLWLSHRAFDVRIHVAEMITRNPKMKTPAKLKLLSCLVGDTEGYDVCPEDVLFQFLKGEGREFTNASLSSLQVFTERSDADRRANAFWFFGRLAEISDDAIPYLVTGLGDFAECDIGSVHSVTIEAIMNIGPKAAAIAKHLLPYLIRNSDADWSVVEAIRSSEPSNTLIKDIENILQGSRLSTDERKDVLEALQNF